MVILFAKITPYNAFFNQVFYDLYFYLNANIIYYFIESYY